MAAADPPVTTQAERDRDSETHKFPTFGGDENKAVGEGGTGATRSEISATSIQSGKSDFFQILRVSSRKDAMKLEFLDGENLTPLIPISTRWASTSCHPPVTRMTPLSFHTDNGDPGLL